VEVVVAKVGVMVVGYSGKGQQEEAVVAERKPVLVVAVLAAVQRELAARKPSAQAPWSTSGPASFVWSLRQLLLTSYAL
jgi:hypothetical protein